MNPSRKRESGMTLIEVMVSVLIFVLGVLGLVAVQARASQLANSAEDRNRAALLANEAIALLYQYTPPSGSATLSIPTSVYAAWQTEVATPSSTGATGKTSGIPGLPNGVGTITGPVPTTIDGVSINLYTVSITWQESSQTSTSGTIYGATAPRVNQYVTEVSIP